MKVTLFVRAPKKAEKRVVVERDVVIGRGKDCNLQVLSNEVSRKHCRLVVGESEVAVRDLGSGNGTLVNGQQTQPNVDEVLISGDIVRIGPLVIKVEFESSISPPAEPAQPEPAAVTSEEVMSDQLLPDASTQTEEPADSQEVTTEEAFAEPIDEHQEIEPFLEPAEEDELLPADDLVEDESIGEFAEADAAAEDVDQPDAEASTTQPPGKMKSLFGMFGKKKKDNTAEPADKTSSDQPAEASGDSVPEPLLDAGNASFDEETVVFDQENAFTQNEDIELLADDDEELSDEGDYLDDEVEEEAVDPGFADFLNNVDQPPN